MVPSMSAANLSFLLCGLVITLGTLLVWAIRIADRWVSTVKVRKNRD
jgi:hypothetical protein